MQPIDTRAVPGLQARACPPNAQADAAKRTRLKFAWLSELNVLLREKTGRLPCKTQKVSHRLVSDLAQELVRYPSFALDAKVWVGQAKLGTRLGVHERQIRRAVAALRTRPAAGRARSSRPAHQSDDTASSWAAAQAKRPHLLRGHMPSGHGLCCSCSCADSSRAPP
jgi:hypothetical protein